MLVAARLAVQCATAAAEQVAEAIDAAERRARSFVPIARVISYLVVGPTSVQSKAALILLSGCRPSDALPCRTRCPGSWPA